MNLLWIFALVLTAQPRDRTYEVRYAAKWQIQLDGKIDEADWRQANVESRFTFPWEKKPAPSTKFRALCDERDFYFAFEIQDADVFVLDNLRDEEDEVFEDRAELYFSRDEQLREYYCLEIDSRGRIFDYRGSFYRKLDATWNWKGPEAKAVRQDHGYTIEARIPVAAFETLGLPRPRPGAKLRCGLYRAEFSHDRSGRPVVQQETIHNRGRKLDGPPPLEAWISWVDPKTAEPDFHVPASLGWLQIIAADSAGPRQVAP